MLTANKRQKGEQEIRKKKDYALVGGEKVGGREKSKKWGKGEKRMCEAFNALYAGESEGKGDGGEEK
jgi:hypothetical protein